MLPAGKAQPSCSMGLVENKPAWARGRKKGPVSTVGAAMSFTSTRVASREASGWIARSIFTSVPTASVENPATPWYTVLLSAFTFNEKLSTVFTAKPLPVVLIEAICASTPVILPFCSLVGGEEIGTGVSVKTGDMV